MTRSITATAIVGLATLANGQGVSLSFEQSCSDSWTDVSVYATFTGYPDPTAYFGGFLGDFVAEPNHGSVGHLQSHMAHDYSTLEFDGATIRNIYIINQALLGTNDPSNPLLIASFRVHEDWQGVPLYYHAVGTGTVYPDDGILTLPDEYDDLWDPGGCTPGVIWSERETADAEDPIDPSLPSCEDADQLIEYLTQDRYVRVSAYGAPGGLCPERVDAMGFDSLDAELHVYWTYGCTALVSAGAIQHSELRADGFSVSAWALGGSGNFSARSLARSHFQTLFRIDRPLAYTLSLNPPYVYGGFRFFGPSLDIDMPGYPFTWLDLQVYSSLAPTASSAGSSSTTRTTSPMARRSTSSSAWASRRATPPILPSRGGCSTSRTSCRLSRPSRRAMSRRTSTGTVCSISATSRRSWSSSSPAARNPSRRVGPGTGRRAFAHRAGAPGVPTRPVGWEGKLSCHVH